jgi:hypothetical protein
MDLEGLAGMGWLAVTAWKLPLASLQIAARETCRPLPVLAAGAAISCACAWRVGAELGLSTQELGFEPLIYEIAFALALLGATLGLGGQESWKWCFKRWQPLEVLSHEALAIGIPALALALVPVVVGALADLGTPTAWGLGFLTLTVARPVAWGLLLLRTPLRPWPRTVALLALCWWIPAALAPSFQPVSTLGADLASGRSEQVPITAGAWVAETSTLLALLLAARLGLAGDRPPR